MMFGTSASTVSYAGFWRRFVAYVLDCTVTVVVPLVFLLNLNVRLPGAEEEADPLGPVVRLVILVAMWLYFALGESSTNQATPGKRVCGLVVTDLNGDRMSFGRASARFAAKFLSGASVGIGFLMIAFTERKQGLHDVLAGTVVIKKR